MLFSRKCCNFAWIYVCKKNFVMNFRTVIDLPPSPICVQPNSRMLLMGSCFVERIGQRLQKSNLSAVVNPFGVQYNPKSISLALRALIKGKSDDSWFFKGSDNLYHSWMHTSLFSGKTLQDCRKKVELGLKEGADTLKSSEVLFVTFGTNHVYYLKGVPSECPANNSALSEASMDRLVRNSELPEASLDCQPSKLDFSDAKPNYPASIKGYLRTNPFVVSNCHKEPAGKFCEATLNVSEIVSDWQELLTLLPKNLHIVFTVSPYRYAKYGYHESQLSKATLLLAIHQLMQEDSEKRLHYFPAYEIVNDELRDYRFYDADMLHPSEQAAEYIWERLQDWCFAASTKEYIREWKPIQKMMEHRLLNDDTEETKKHHEIIEKRVQQFKNKWQL